MSFRTLDLPPVTLPAPRGAVVDCDGTLVTTEQVWGVAERAVTEALGGVWSWELKRRLVGQSIEASALAVVRWAGADEARAGEIAVALGDAFAQALLTEPVEPKPGAVAFLAQLAALGAPVAVASNGTRDDVEVALRRAGLRDAVHSIHVPGAAHRPKPAPDLFVAGCAAIGVAPADAIAVEDAAPGLHAARVAGMTTVAVPSIPGQALEADVLVTSLEQLRFAT